MTDTESLMYKIEAENVQEDLCKIKNCSTSVIIQKI